MYRKKHDLVGASGAGTNYQVGIKVYRTTGTDGTEVVDGITMGKVYIGTKCRTDFQDIRFTDNDQSTLLDYWLQEKVDGSYAIFWVEVTDSLESGTVPIYVYYNKSDASSLSNGTNTFLLFEDFSGTLANWTVVAGQWTIQSGTLQGVSAGGQYNNTIKRNSFTFTSGMIASWKQKRESGTWGGCAVRYLDGSNFIMAYGTSDNRLYMSAKIGGVWDEQYENCPFTVNVWYRVQCREKASYDFQARCGILSKSNTVSNTSGSLAFIIDNVSGDISYFDDLFVRKSTDPEPTHSTWYSEEETTTTPTVTTQDATNLEVY
jgi:hypothetical protein